MMGETQELLTEVTDMDEQLIRFWQAQAMPQEREVEMCRCETMKVVDQLPAKSKRGREEGDGTENVINCRDVCRKLS